jgi:hypothetical protein
MQINQQMNASLLFLPDISGFTEFVQTTEVEHSQHVISELLEILIDANTEELQLAEIEGDALFFYKENEIPSLEKLLAQAEHMFTAFYSHLKLLEKNRICPCNACSTAPNLQLKIIAHCGELQFITVQNNRKPFGAEVIEAHRLMKNSVQSDNYVLLSANLTSHLQLDESYQTKLFSFQKGNDTYDSNNLDYYYSILDAENLKLKPFQQAKKVEFQRKPDFTITHELPIAAQELMELLSNFNYRKHWVEDVEFQFDSNQVNRVGTEHICVIKDKHLNFTTITKKGKPGQLVYGEMTTTPKPIDALYQYQIITPLTDNSCRLETEVYIEATSIFKKILVFLLIKRAFKKGTTEAMQKLKNFVVSQNNL